MDDAAADGDAAKVKCFNMYWSSHGCISKRKVLWQREGRYIPISEAHFFQKFAFSVLCFSATNAS